MIGCAAPEVAETGGETAYTGGSDCITEGRIRSYKVLDESNLVVTATARRQYHVELARSASGLDFARSIGFKSPTSRICSSFSYVVVDDGFGGERVRIDSIRRLTDEDYEDLLHRFDKSGRQQPPQPDKVEGAEVEELD